MIISPEWSPTSMLKQAELKIWMTAGLLQTNFVLAGLTELSYLSIERVLSLLLLLLTTFPNLRGSFKKDTCPRHEK